MGAEEIEVGGAGFAAGDQVITRVNDRPPTSTTASAGKSAAVDAERGRVVLEGIDQARRVEVGPRLPRADDLGRRGSGAPARLRRDHLLRPGHDRRSRLRHGRSLDGQAGDLRRHLAHPRADLSLRDPRDPGRARGVRAGCDPRAIQSPTSREAAERDRAQTAAHDEALRAELAKLPTAELAVRRDKLDTPARFEARHQEDYARQVRAVEERRGQVERAGADREAVEALGWRERRRKLPYAHGKGAATYRTADRGEGEAGADGATGHGSPA